jgi:hypothetical protein
LKSECSTETIIDSLNDLFEILHHLVSDVGGDDSRRFHSRALGAAGITGDSVFPLMASIVSPSTGRGANRQFYLFSILLVG